MVLMWHHTFIIMLVCNIFVIFQKYHHPFGRLVALFLLGFYINVILVINPCNARKNFVIRYNIYIYIILIECHNVNKEKNKKKIKTEKIKSPL